MIQNVIKRSDNTEVTPVKEGSFSFVEQVNEEGNLRFGSVISSYIHAEVFGSASLSVGDIVTYWQRTDIGYDFTPLGYNREFQIGIFIVTDVIQSKASFSFTAYDYVRKLEVDFSNQLIRLKSSFPMTMSSLITAIANYSGATIDTTNLLLLSRGYDVVIKWFYSDGITAKEVLSYIAEISGVYAKCNASGTICFGGYDYALVDPYPNWTNGTGVIICPTDTVTYYDSNHDVLTPIWYKENGFEKANYQCAEIDAVYVKKTDGTTLFGIINSTVSGANTFTISANPIIDNIDFTTGAYSELDVFGISTLYLENLIVQGVTPFTVKLFPFRNPFRAGDEVYYIEDTSGVRFKSLVMKMEVTDSEVVLSCFGNEKYSNSEKDVTVAESVVAMSAQINDKVSKSGDTMTGALNLAVPLAIASGGIGQSGLITETTISDIAVAGSDCTIISASFSVFGKIAQIAINVTKSTAQTTVATVTMATLVSGKRPALTTGVMTNNANAVYAYVGSNGAINVRGTFNANQSVAVFATYLLP